MRLTPDQQAKIRSVVSSIVGNTAKILLFGSRVDDSAKGGDVDLLITLPQPLNNTIYTASLIEAKLERALEGRKVDVVLYIANTPLLPIHEAAISTGVAL